MKILRLSTLIVAAIAALLGVLPFQPQLRPNAGGFAVEVSLTSHLTSELQVFYDSGDGYSERQSTIVLLLAKNGPQTYRLVLPEGDYRGFRLDPMNRDGSVVIHSVRIVDGTGKIRRELPLSSFLPSDDVQSLNPVPGGMAMTVIPGRQDPQLITTTTPVVSLHLPFSTRIYPWLRSAAVLWVVLILFGVAAEFLAPVRRRFNRFLEWLRGNPRRAIALAALFGVGLSCYPIIFAGRSFVSPNRGAWLLYDRFPTLPGYSDSHVEDVRGSDIGAIIWQQVPYSSIQHRSLLENFELPLWNRYNSGGLPLLGQGQSMLGDPLHCLVIAANGAAWAWDLKYLIARWLLALGLGLAVWALAGHRGAAMLVALAAPFCGFFIYRVNHPAVFSFCYAPWIIYFWVRVVQSPNWRAMVPTAAGLLLANWTELNSGTVKEAYTFLLTMNLTGGVMLLFSAEPWRWRLKQFAVLFAAAILFAGLTSPVWYTFLDALRHGFTSSDATAAFQIQPSLLIGLFDEALFRPLTRDLTLFNPSANFLILAGVLYFFATLRERLRERPARAILISSLLPLALAFGVVPPDWIERLPFLGNIHHIDDCFGSALILLAALIAGLGFAAADRRLRTAEGSADLGIAAILLGTLLGAYFGFGHAVHRALQGEATPTVSVWPFGGQMAYRSFVLGYLSSLVVALILGGILARRALLSGVRRPALDLALIVCGLTLVWRGGQYTGEVSWPDFIVQPGPRADFRAPSSAEQAIEKSNHSVPVRAIGLYSNFFPGWTAMYGVEAITGPDALGNRYYQELMDAFPLDHLWGWRLYLTRDNVAPSRPFLDVLNVRHYLDLRGDRDVLSAVLQPDQFSDMDLYDSPTAWPRAFFVDRVKTYQAPTDLVALIAGDHDRPFAAFQSGEVAPDSSLVALISSDQPAHYAAGTAYHLTENSTSFAVHAAVSGLVVLSETFWSGYPHAQVDGNPVHVIRTNHAFIGIPVAAGDHRITVRYRPRFFDLNLLIAAVSGLVLAGGFWAAWRTKSLLA